MSHASPAARMKVISYQISASRKQRQDASPSRGWRAGRAQLREGFWVKQSEGDLEEDETLEPFRVGWNVQERVLGIGESDEISKILSFTGHFADERELRAGASQGGYWSWPGVWCVWRCARLRLWILRLLPVCLRAVRLLRAGLLCRWSVYWCWAMVSRLRARLLRTRRRLLWPPRLQPWGIRLQIG